ncbi:hypothetical protein QOZ80_2AG0116980 [Eleusine coracana subsp. coracana]|nr:hypothetical protein QOZ80_2AG0116980 [Eleusine coracana subsp. coracana]
MSSATIAGCFRDKTILITGGTGFLGKMVVEKILRVQPDVKQLYLMVRAPNNASAKKRVLTEVIGKDLFNVLGEEHGANFDNFIDTKITPIAGDIIYEDFGCDKSEIAKLAEEIDIIINGAAITNFYERYDVALATNTLGVKYLLQFAKNCANLKMLLHISTAYVAGPRKGLLLEEPLKMGATLKQGLTLDISTETKLIEKLKSDLHSAKRSPHSEKIAMKELGLKRARHFGWPNTYVFTKAMGEMLLDNLGADLPVVIARPSIVLSTIEDPMPGWIEGVRTTDAFIVGYADQTIPCFALDDKSIIDTIPGDMVINAMLPIEVLHMVNLFPFKLFSCHYNKLKRKYDRFLRLAKFYAPYSFNKGYFDVTNLKKLRTAARKDYCDAYMFNFDPKCINWGSFLFNIHIPAVIKHALEKKTGTST